MEKEESWSGKCWQFRSLRLTPMMLDLLKIWAMTCLQHQVLMQSAIARDLHVFPRSCSNSWINGKSKYPPQWLWNSHFWRLQNMQVLLVPFELQGWTLSGWSIKDVVQLFFCPEDTKNWIEGKITGAVYHGGKESHPKMFDMLSWFKLGKFHTDLKQPLAPPKTNPW